MSVYFIRSARSGNVKIGWSANLPARLSALQCASDGRIILIRKLDGGRATERWLHQRFADARLKGEWFAFRDEMLTVAPPDEISVPRKVTIRRDVRLTLRERLRDSCAIGKDIGISAQQILLTFIAELTEDEASQMIDFIREHAADEIRQAEAA